jgi:hypothetical protein
MSKNLKQIASECETFEEFRSKAEKQDRLFRTEQHPDRFTKQARSPKNLKELASTAVNFQDFLNKAHEGE